MARRCAGEIAGDILAFMRTQTLAQIQGVAGLQHLRQDLNERVATRSRGQRARVHHQNRWWSNEDASSSEPAPSARPDREPPRSAQTGDLASALNSRWAARRAAASSSSSSLLTMLSLAPGLLMMVTSFTRFVIALSFLRSGLGLQSTPANLVLISLSLFMTFYVMAPTFDKSWKDGIKPMMDKPAQRGTGLSEESSSRSGEFMLAQMRDKDLKTVRGSVARRLRGQATARRVDLRLLIPAFMISELRRGFEMGFLIVLPFLVIDMIVATLTMSMGMMMLPPSLISLPMKMLFFVLIDGWNMLIGSLVRSVN